MFRQQRLGRRFVPLNGLRLANAEGYSAAPGQHAPKRAADRQETETAALTAACRPPPEPWPWTSVYRIEQFMNRSAEVA
jgi:hypothetical protein